MSSTHTAARSGARAVLPRHALVRGTRAPPRSARLGVVLGAILLSASAVWLGAQSEHIARPVTTGLYYGYLVAASLLVGLYWWVRRPESRLGVLLIAYGVVLSVVSWQSSDHSQLSTLGVLGDVPGVVLTFALILVFPLGRVRAGVDRVILATLAMGVAGFYLAAALLSPAISGGGPLARCVTACPDNALQVGSRPGLVHDLHHLAVWVAIAAAAATAVVFGHRFWRASRPQRRALAAVGVTSLLFLPAFSAYQFARVIVDADTDVLDNLGWALIAARVVFPLGFLIAILHADLVAGSALPRLLDRLADRPSPEEWHHEVADALDDPSLRLAYWDTASGRYREADGSEAAPPTARSGRAWVPVDRGDHPLAAMAMDERSLENPELIRATALATVLAVENGDLEGELRSSRARIVEAGDTERRRIERDLHDSAQQRLVALRLHIGLARDRLRLPEERELVEQLGRELDEAIDDLRRLARGVYPQILLEHGLGAALRSVAKTAAIPVTIEDGDLGRYPAALELTVYFCCLEALQNSAKHGGPGTTAVVRLTERAGVVSFSVEDDGRGFDPNTVEPGGGLANLVDRVGAVGGALRVDSAPGLGTTITGVAPAAAE
jgi:signal transduction histidine kinase